MKRTPIAALSRRARRWQPALGAAALGLALVVPSLDAATTMYNPKVALPGGVDPRPTILSVTKTNNETTITVSGLYGPFTMVSTPTVTGTEYTTVASSDSTTNLASITAVLGETSFIKAEAPANYLGADYCALCHQHSGYYNSWTNTAHAHALQTLQAIGTDKIPTCLKCHTVGYGLSNGYKNVETTPHLAGVQCENCHGPAGSHVANIRDLSVVPKVTPSAAICGGCHTDAHHPTYDEWLESGHSVMDPHVAGYFLDPVTGPARMQACGPCHSGAVRLTMLHQEPLPTGADAAEFPVTCAVCHDPHADTGNGAQLRNPTFSLIPFSYSTSTLTDFQKQYNPAVQMCGQCHNMRGARWQDTGRPPHHSPQYNVLIGNISDPTLPPPLVQSSHRMSPQQCTHCHTHQHTVENPDENNPNYTGHRFEPMLSNCEPCHDEASAGVLVESTQTRTMGLIDTVVASLNTWGETKAPEPLRTTYGKASWEYASAGALSNPEADPTFKSPTNAEQSLIPETIKKARMYVYLVAHDGSYGVHNSRYAEYLLTQAKQNVDAAMAAP